jgi:HEAT repeat protein
MSDQDLRPPKDPNLDVPEVLKRLNHAVASRDPDEISDAVTSAHQVGVQPVFVPALLSLLDLPNHSSHEDIVNAFQDLRDPTTTEALFRTANAHYQYLDYDEGFSLARKCTWALADIGTADALAKLRLLAASDNSVIAGYAQRRIDGWQNEKHRKRA